jgi:hypothetical protein
LNTNSKNLQYVDNYRVSSLSENGTRETQRLVRAIAILIRNTTWRCGRLERLIVRKLYRRNSHLGKPEMAIKEMIEDFNLTGKKKNEFLDAIRRLERRNIIRILTL